MSDIRLYMFEGGVGEVPLQGWAFGAPAGEMIRVPHPWFLITHPRGNVVIDGGPAAEAAVNAKAHWGVIAETATLFMRPDQAVVPMLEKLGIDLASIRWVVQSHLHVDHSGAVAAIGSFPNAEVLVTRTEYEWAHAPDSLAGIAYCKADYVKPGIEWFTLEETDDGYDLFGDGTLRCWRTPGHSPGHQSFEVTLGSGETYLLLADAANSMDHFAGRVLPGVMISSVETIRSVRKLRRLAWRSQAIVVPGHDPELWPSFRQAPEYYA